MISKYEQSRHFVDFHIAGFTYNDGLDVIEDLKLATVVELRSESDNPYDPNAVAIYFYEKRIGYVPQVENSIISKLLYFGHDIFEASISAVALDQHPEKQFRVSVRLKDRRKV
jgi:hypothetical protein